MKTVKVSNFMAVKTAQFDIHKTTLILGDNEQGKSSILIGLNACLSGNSTPVDGVTKSSAMQLVNEDAREGSVIVAEGESSRAMLWPDCKVKEKAFALKTSDASLGFNPLNIQDKKAKSKFFSDFLGINPNEEDLKAELEELIDGNEKVFKTIWSNVEINGWDKASSLYADKSKESQGAFKATTGSSGWGEAKGEKWLPEHWSPDLESASQEALEDAKVNAQKEVDACIASDAVSEEKLKELELLAEQLPDLTTRRDKNLRLIEKAREKIRKMGARPEKIIPGDVGLPCPHCGSHLVKMNGILDFADTSAFSEVEAEDRAKEIAKYNEELQNIEHHKSVAEKENIEYEGMIKKATAAEVKLAETLSDRLASSDSQKDQDKARERLRIASANLESFLQKKKAEKSHKAAIYYRRLSQVLAPDGLRKKVLSEKIEELNEEIKSLFPEFPLTIDEDLIPKWDGRILALSCESAKWRAGIVIRAIIAKRNEDEVFLVDGLDILSNANANTLIKRMRKIPANVIYTSTVKKASEVKQLPEKFGKAYFIEAGILREVEA